MNENLTHAQKEKKTIEILKKAIAKELENKKNDKMRNL